MTNEQALSLLSDGLLKHAAGVIAQAVAGTDYSVPGHTHVAANITDFAAAVVALLLDANIPNNLTLDNITQITSRSHTNLSDIGTNTHAQIDTFISGITETAQDAAGAALADTTEIDLTYDDAANQIKADLKNNSVAPARLTTAGKTVSRILYLENPAATDVIPMCYVGDAVTIIAIRSVTDAGTVTFNIEQRGKFTPATAGTDCLAADQVADTTGEEVTSGFNDATVPADNWLVFVASAVASSPTKLWVSIEYTID